jgi:hypothetical protein
MEYHGTTNIYTSLSTKLNCKTDGTEIMKEENKESRSVE